MTLKRVWLIPVTSTVLSLGSFFISYIVAVANRHVDALLPFISDTGTLSPESCIFAQLLNLSAIFMGISMYLRHRQIVEYYGHRLQMQGKGRWRRASAGLLLIGYAAAFCISLVANFQETRVPGVHNWAALMAFFAGLVYCWGQVIFSYRLTPRMSAVALSHFRALLCAFATIFLLLHVVCNFAEPFVKKQPATANNLTTTLENDYVLEAHYNPSSPKYANHLVTTFAEWLMAICFELFILSFAIELRHAYAHAPQLLLRQAGEEHDNRAAPAAAAAARVKVSYIVPADSLNGTQATSNTTLASRS